jgi:hypothetical protein
MTEEQGHLHVRQGHIDIKDEKKESTDVSVAYEHSARYVEGATTLTRKAVTIHCAGRELHANTELCNKRWGHRYNNESSTLMPTN